MSLCCYPSCMRRFAFLLALAACGEPGAAEGACPRSALAPPSSGRPDSTTIGPLTVDGAGVDFCLHLDTRKLGRAHIMAGTPNEPGEVSSYRLTLSRPDGSLIVEGWDVNISGPQVFTNLEWSPPAKQELDVVLHVASKAAKAKPVTVNVSLFDPLE